MERNLFLIRDIIVNPYRAMLLIKEERPYFLVFLIYFFSKISAVTARYMVMDYRIPGEKLFLATLVTSVLGVTFLFILAAVFHLLADLLNSQGKSTSLFCLLLAANLPGIFFSSVSLILGGLNLQNNFFLGFSKFLIFVWIMFLVVKAVQANYNFTLTRTFLLFGLFFLLIVLLSLFFSIGWIKLLLMDLVY